MDEFKLDEPKPPFGFVPTKQTDTYDFISPTKANLAGKYVAITGATRGVGQAMAVSYAKAGVSGLALLARSNLSETVKAIESAVKEVGHKSSPKVVTIKTDTTSLSDVTNAAEIISKEFNGRVDILINNAGYLETWKPVGESDPEEWWKTWEVNVKGTYLVTRAFLSLVLKSDLKTIVQTASYGGVTVTGGASAYQGSKTANIRFNDHLMAEYGEQGLLAFSIHPGAVKTDLATNLPEFMHAILTDTPELCGDTVVWLTKERRPWLADRFVSVTWDMKEFETKKEEIEDGNLLRVRLKA